MGKKGERYKVVSPYDENGLFILKNKQKSKMIIHYLQCFTSSVFLCCIRNILYMQHLRVA